MTKGDSVLPMRPLKTRFEAYLRRNNLVRRGDTVLLAVSGGMDSMTMLRLFTELRASWELKLGIIHVNHLLRGSESDEDELFVQREAHRLSLLFHSLRRDTAAYCTERHLTKQEGARKLRYEFFNEIRIKTNANDVATAHNANDNAETVLLNIIRGTGVRGLAGIPVRREHIIRPLLFVSRREIEQFAEKHSIAFRNDSSNNSLKYQRNILRHKIIPRLQLNSGGDIVQSLNEVSTFMRQVDTMLQKRMEKHFHRFKARAGVVELDTASLLREPDFVQEQVILQVQRNLSIEPTREKTNSILRLLHQPTGTRLDLGKQFTIFRDRQRLVVREAPGTSFNDQPVVVGKGYSFPAFQFSSSAPEAMPSSLKNRQRFEFVDAEKLGKNLILRSWRRGDWFIPLGLGHKKKLSDFLVDEKVPLFEKSQIPVLESHGRIVWVCGKRLDDRFKVTPSTRSVVRLSYRAHAHG